MLRRRCRRKTGIPIQREDKPADTDMSTILSSQMEVFCRNFAWPSIPLAIDYPLFPIY